MKTYIVNVMVMNKNSDMYHVKLDANTDENAKNEAIDMVAEEGDFNKKLSIEDRKKMLYVQSCVEFI